MVIGGEQFKFLPTAQKKKKSTDVFIHLSIVLYNYIYVIFFVHVLNIT